MAARLSFNINRAPVLTLWSSVVAERLGHPRATALTLGKAVGGTTARLKVRIIGREEWTGGRGELGPTLDLDIPRQPKPHVTAQVLLLGKRIRLLRDAGGELRAALRTLPTRDGVLADEYVAADPAEVERYLARAFGDHLAEVRTAMEVLAARYEPMELNRIGSRLYEKFRPTVLHGNEGRRARAMLEVGKILSAT